MYPGPALDGLKTSMENNKNIDTIWIIHESDYETTVCNLISGCEIELMVIKLLACRSRTLHVWSFGKIWYIYTAVTSSAYRPSFCFQRVFEHDDVIKWKQFPRYWAFVRGIHRLLLNSPHKGQRRENLMFSFICARVSGWVNNRQAVNLRRNRAYNDTSS